MRVYKHTTCFGRFAGKVEALITISEKLADDGKFCFHGVFPLFLSTPNGRHTWFRDLLLSICLKCDCLHCTTTAWRRCLSFYDEAEEMERVHLWSSIFYEPVRMEIDRTWYWNRGYEQMLEVGSVQVCASLRVGTRDRARGWTARGAGLTAAKRKQMRSHLNQMLEGSLLAWKKPRQFVIVITRQHFVNLGGVVVDYWAHFHARHILVLFWISSIFQVMSTRAKPD